MTNNVRESTAPSKTPYPMAPIGKNGSPSQDNFDNLKNLYVMQE